MIRAKFVCESKKPTGYGPQEQVTFRTQYSPEVSEDVSFNTSTPNGLIEMTVDNPAALDQLVVGEAYYVDFSLVKAIKD